MVKTVNESNFAAEVLNAAGGVVVDMYADWCGPCKMMAPVVEELSESMENVKFCKLNVDTAPHVAAQYRVMSIPTFLFFKDGELAGSVIGGMDEESLEEEIRKALKEAVSADNNHIQYEFGKYSRIKGASGTSSIVIVKDTSTGDYKYILMHDKGKVFTFPDRRYSDIYLWDLGLWKDQLESIPENIEDKLDNNSRDPEYTFHDILRNAQRADPTDVYNVVKHISVAKAVKAAVTDMTNREYIIITTNKTRQNKAIQRYDAREGMIENTAEQNIELAQENRKRWKAALDALRAGKAAIDLVKDVSSAEPLFKRYISVFSKFDGTDIYNAPENRGKYLELMDSFVSLNNAIEYIKDAIENIKKDHRRASDSYYAKKIEVAKTRFNKYKKEVEDLLDELS